KPSDAPAVAYVAIPDGSSSDAPVTRPGPRTPRRRRKRERRCRRAIGAVGSDCTIVGARPRAGPSRRRGLDTQKFEPHRGTVGAGEASFSVAISWTIAAARMLASKFSP